MKTKKLILMQLSLFAWTALFSAQTTQEQADSIVSERLNGETQLYIVYAKEDVQKDMIITSVAGERLKMNYSCWVYYIHYADSGQGRYLIVKESNGNLLEVNAKSGAEPDDLAEWRIVPIEIFFTEFSIGVASGGGCRWSINNINFNNQIVVFNNNEELGNYIDCSVGSFPEIDFENYSLIRATWGTPSSSSVIEKIQLLKISVNEYILNIEFRQKSADLFWQSWIKTIRVPKLHENSIATLKVSRAL